MNYNVFENGMTTSLPGKDKLYKFNLFLLASAMIVLGVAVVLTNNYEAILNSIK